MSDEVQLDDECACRDWLQACHVDLPHTFVMPRIREVAAMLDAMPDDTVRLVWSAQEIVALTTGGYKLNKAALEKVRKTLADAATATPYGALLRERRIDQDRQIAWLVHTHSRPPATPAQLAATGNQQAIAELRNPTINRDGSIRKD